MEFFSLRVVSYTLSTMLQVTNRLTKLHLAENITFSVIHVCSGKFVRRGLFVTEYVHPTAVTDNQWLLRRSQI